MFPLSQKLTVTTVVSSFALIGAASSAPVEDEARLRKLEHTISGPPLGCKLGLPGALPPGVYFNSCCASDGCEDGYSTIMSNNCLTCSIRAGDEHCPIGSICKANSGSQTVTGCKIGYTRTDFDYDAGGHTSVDWTLCTPYQAAPEPPTYSTQCPTGCICDNGVAGSQGFATCAQCIAGYTRTITTFCESGYNPDQQRCIDGRDPQNVMQCLPSR